MTITDQELSLHEGTLASYKRQFPDKGFQVDVDYLLALIREVRAARKART